MPNSRWSDLERPPLDVRALNRSLTRDGAWREIRVVEQTGSTNADVVELARHGEPEKLVLVAEHQVAGRGRHGRQWSAPPRSGLSFSALLRPTSVAQDRWPLVSVLAGVGVARAVAGVTDVEITLKWPNDLMVGDRKLGGILAERVEGDGEIGPAVVVGVGLNVTLRDAELPVPTAISLALAGAAHTDRDTVLRAALRGLADEYDAWVESEGDSARLLRRYRELCATIGRRVRAELPGDEAVEGLATGVDDDGGLVIETASGARTVKVGDVVHLR